jgi:hypothetical protein
MLVLIRSLMRGLPLLIIPWLVPLGSPRYLPEHFVAIIPHASLSDEMLQTAQDGRVHSRRPGAPREPGEPMTN